MRNSVFWAKLLGFYTVTMAVGIHFHIKEFQSWMSTLTTQPSTLMIMGMFTLFLGWAIVVSHQVWRGWPILITLLGYWITAKGIILLFFPGVIQKVMAFGQTQNIQYAPLPAFVIGLILLLCAFFFHKRKEH